MTHKIAYKRNPRIGLNKVTLEIHNMHLNNAHLMSQKDMYYSQFNFPSSVSKTVQNIHLIQTTTLTKKVNLKVYVVYTCLFDASLFIC